MSDSLFSLLPSISSPPIALFPFLGGNGETYASSLCHFQFLGDLPSHPEGLELICFVSGSGVEGAGWEGIRVLPWVRLRGATWECGGGAVPGEQRGSLGAPFSYF